MRYDLPVIYAAEAAVDLVQGQGGRNKANTTCRDGGELNKYTIGAYEVDE